MKTPIIIALIFLAIIMLMFLAAVWISGSTGDSLTIKEIIDHPERYMNKEVTIRAYYDKEEDTVYQKETGRMSIKFQNTIMKSSLTHGREYSWTGIVRVITEGFYGYSELKLKHFEVANIQL